VTGRLAALFDAPAPVAAGVAVAEGEGVAFALFVGADGCVVFVGAPVVQALAAKSSDARTSAGVAFRIVFILKSTLLTWTSV
jgi:hypothetical protein